MNTPKNNDLRILVTNDDGIHAPGIEVLENIARGFTDDVWVVAPDQERSGAGHSISLTNPIRMRRLDERHFEVNGTPTDCVLMAVSQILHDRRPTYVLSGINSGANLAEDVSYSGTIAAAMEGTVMGIRSIALSQLRGPNRSVDFAPCEMYGPDLIHSLLTLEHWPENSFININFPHAKTTEITGARLTTQGQRPPGSYSIERRTDTRAQAYYWIKIDFKEGNRHPETDLRAIADNAISVTPIKMDFTDTAWRSELQSLLDL
ncbi:MAG: 5'/3'-nucleotidase SurE [Proteobacteria bacterium]|nr:5'/3'-nucleotidase SurE [Pseudomonadota bacterium]